MLRALMIFCCCMALGACKVEVIVPEGGYVSVVSSDDICAEGRICTFSVVDIYFDEAFEAVPKIGYTFKGWKKRHKGLCGGSKSLCELSTAGFAGNGPLIAFLESNETFYLEAVFESAPRAPIAAPAHLGLWGGEYSDVFIGCLTCGPSDSDSVCNKFGSYGNRFFGSSIWSETGDFGPQYSNYSPWDKYATKPPAVHDINGAFYGYLTANKYLSNPIDDATLEQLVEYASSGNYDLDDVRNWFCK